MTLSQKKMRDEIDLQIQTIHTKNGYRAEPGHLWKSLHLANAYVRKFDKIDEFASIFESHEWKDVPIDKMAFLFTMAELNMSSDHCALIMPTIPIGVRRSLIDAIRKFVTCLSDQRNELVDQLLDNHLKTLHGRSLSEDGLFALGPRREDEGRKFGELLSCNTYFIDGSKFPMNLLADSLKRRGYSDGRNFVILALETKRLPATPQNFEALFTWLTYVCNFSATSIQTDVEKVRNLDITFRVMSEGPFTIQRFVDRYYNTTSTRLMRNIFTVVGPNTQGVFELLRRYTQFANDTYDTMMLAHRQYWNLRVNMLIDKVKMPRCLAELVVGYLKLDEK